MKIKKYLVKNLEEAIYKIKQELGEDAYIMDQKKIVKKGTLNLASQEMIEVTAAVDNNSDQGFDISSALLRKKYGSSSGTEKRDVFIKEDIAKKPVKKEDHFEDLKNLKSELIPLKDEVEEIKMLLKRSASESGTSAEDFKGIYFEYFMNLIESGVKRETAKKVINSLMYQTSDKQRNREFVKRQLNSILASLMATPAPLRISGDQRRIVAAVGPTGVGKTTTIAKLSAYYNLMENLKVALITLDSFRIGAEAHMRTYAQILDIPFFTVYNKKELNYRISELKEMDIIFIDTAGRGSYDDKGISETADLLRSIPSENLDTMLLLSATTKSEDLFRIYDKFSVLRPSRLVFSKIDETCSLGNLFNLMVKSNIPAAYFTTGQKVPEDIEIAYPRKLARMIINDKQEKINESGINSI